MKTTTMSWILVLATMILSAGCENDLLGPRVASLELRVKVLETANSEKFAATPEKVQVTEPMTMYEYDDAKSKWGECVQKMGSKDLRKRAEGFWCKPDGKVPTKICGSLLDYEDRWAGHPYIDTESRLLGWGSVTAPAEKKASFQVIFHWFAYISSNHVMIDLHGLPNELVIQPGSRHAFGPDDLDKPIYPAMHKAFRSLYKNLSKAANSNLWWQDEGKYELATYGTSFFTDKGKKIGKLEGNTKDAVDYFNRMFKKAGFKPIEHHALDSTAWKGRPDFNVDDDLNMYVRKYLLKTKLAETCGDKPVKSSH